MRRAVQHGRVHKAGNAFLDGKLMRCGFTFCSVVCLKHKVEASVALSNLGDKRRTYYTSMCMVVVDPVF